ncbi:MAG TPA: polyprenyl synthetase family protein [Candidatus Polarisedimenticolia bacterium]
MPAPGRVSTRGLDAWLASWRGQIDEALPSFLPAGDGPGLRSMAAPVREAMAYALLAPGKRIRPTLTLAVGEMFRADTRRLLPAACSIEMVHASSLILDDLPCMDDSPLRRGRPSCHVAFGESTAILAAVGLLNHAYAILAGEVDRARIKEVTRERLRSLSARRLAAAIGPDGVIGGQFADLEAGRGGTAGGRVDLPAMEFIHSRKTGSLFIASAEIGARLSGGLEEEVEGLVSYAKNLGLAFQITDDLIDAVGDSSAVGKPVRADAGRATFVTLCGVEGARSLAGDLVRTAITSLAPFGRGAERLRELARHVAVRDR